MAILGNLPKLKRGLGLAFGAFFLHGFPIKMFLIEYSMSYLQDIKQNVLLSSYLGS